MSRRSIRARPPAGSAAVPAIGRDPDVLAAHLEDAAHFPDGFAWGLASPSTEGEVAGLMRTAATILPIGAQSSLTGGATPRGEVLLSTSRLNRIISIGDDWVRAEAGVFELELSDRTADVPVPRYQLPHVPKVSAGYFAAPNMDLIDLFIGSEGTLGVITEVTLRVLRERPAQCVAFVPFEDAEAA